MNRGFAEVRGELSDVTAELISLFECLSETNRVVPSVCPELRKKRDELERELMSLCEQTQTDISGSAAVGRAKSSVEYSSHSGLVEIIYLMSYLYLCYSFFYW